MVVMQKSNTIDRNLVKQYNKISEIPCGER